MTVAQDLIGKAERREALFGIIGLALADPLVAMIKVWLERSAERRHPAGAA